jgi:protein ImuA
MNMTLNPLLDRKHHETRPKLEIHDGVGLTLGRAHEICGNARRTFAFWTGGKTNGPVLWIRPGWMADHPYPRGVLQWMEPGRLMLARCRRAEDLLWSMEEALRSGAVQLVVADLFDPPGLTQVRRLHLAAETGAAEGDYAPLGLILTPGDGGAPGVETRWNMAAAHEDRAARWHLTRIRARNDAPKSWLMEKGKTRIKLTPHGA